ncbi:MAG TPA: hypothetical protein VL400_00780 [Polyangiaceae bacterium]|nr:hypothetical protein [Polyangiaceae bacterium]
MTLGVVVGRSRFGCVRRLREVRKNHRRSVLEPRHSSSGRLRALVAVVPLFVALGCSSTLPTPEGFSAPVASPPAAEADRPTGELVAAAVGGHATEAELDALRARGPAALDALLAAYDALPVERRPAARSAIDHVAAQRDADVSRLYWYTDFEQAKRAARDAGKPILSLRMLGRLTDDLSCANSRFFRTTLYANSVVSKELREKFILHWSTEREAPLVTIDFRDGRKIQRTITGNSLHYVLDADGRPLDAIPGLYAPDAFLAALADAESLAETERRADGADAAKVVAAHHRAKVGAFASTWRVATTSVGFPNAAPPVAFASAPTAPPSQLPSAAIAMPIAAPKAAVEMPILQATQQPADGMLVASPSVVPSEVWAALARAKQGSTHLDDQSRRLVARKEPMEWRDAAGPRPLQGAELDALFARFEAKMAEDTVKNELDLHARIHGWLADDRGVDLKTLNERVYREIFLTPASDPWLGLVPPDAFTGIQGDGIVTK